MPVRRQLTIVCIAIAASPLAAHAVTQADYMPPPGLYRIDLDSTIKVTTPVNAILHRMQRDGASGTEKASGRKADGSWVEGGSYQGAGPVTQCVKPAAPSPVGLLDSRAACVQRGGALENGAWVIRQRCAQDDYEITIRKTGNSTWEYKTDVLQKGSAPATPQSTEDRIIAMVRASRAHARTDAERAEIDANLAEYERRTREEQAKTGPFARAPASAAQQSASGAKTRRVVGVQKWTRIADTCGAAKK